MGPRPFQANQGSLSRQVSAQHDLPPPIRPEAIVTGELTTLGPPAAIDGGIHTTALRACNWRRVMSMSNDCDS